MYIYLANSHEAVVINDQSSVVTVSGGEEGILTVAGKDYAITNGCTIPVIDIEYTARINAAFITKSGIAYTIVAPRVEKKALVSRPDPYAYILQQRIKIDELEKGLESANERIRKLEGMHQRRALNGIFKFKEV